MTTSWHEFVDQRCRDQFDDFVALRRHLHQHPEPSGEEKETSLLLYSKLGNQGLEVQLGPDGNGVVADLRSQGSKPQPMIALRGDIDALRIQDQKDVAYQSCREGVMHACGHDAHATIVYGAVTSLQQLSVEGKLPWPVSVRAIFQPAEEICRGAQQMIDAGCMTDVKNILSVHMEPKLPIGKIGFRHGVLTASCDEILFTIRGHGAHGARPHESRDPISAAADLIHALYTHIPRVTDSQDAVVISIGQIAGGHNFNVIPEEVQLHGTLRTLDPKVRDKAVDHIRRIADGVGTTSQTNVDVRFGLSAPPVINDLKLVAEVERWCVNLLGDDAIFIVPRPSMGGEDFSFYLQHAAGCMLRLGSASEKIGMHGLHSPRFDIDERALDIGVRVLTRSAIELSRPK